MDHTPPTWPVPPASHRKVAAYLRKLRALDASATVRCAVDETGWWLTLTATTPFHTLVETAVPLAACIPATDRTFPLAQLTCCTTPGHRGGTDLTGPDATLARLTAPRPTRWHALGTLATRDVLADDAEAVRQLRDRHHAGDASAVLDERAFVVPTPAGNVHIPRRPFRTASALGMFTPDSTQTIPPYVQLFTADRWLAVQIGAHTHIYQRRERPWLPRNTPLARAA